MIFVVFVSFWFWHWSGLVFAVSMTQNLSRKIGAASRCHETADFSPSDGILLARPRVAHKGLLATSTADWLRTPLMAARQPCIS
jgi:hypothetical protein